VRQEAVRLPEYRVKARNTSTSSENKIHDDAVARRYGFGGGLVPGVSVYAYATRPLVEALGPDWLGRGTASVKFVKPIFHGDEVRVCGNFERGAEGVTATLTVTAANGDCAFATATLAHGAGAPVDASSYRSAPLPAERPAATREHLASLDVLGTIITQYDRAVAAQFVERIDDKLQLYGVPDDYVHPAFFLNQANQALKSNVSLGPWIHTGSIVRHLSIARIGETLSTQGRVHALTEKKGAQIVELDLLLFAGSRPVAQVYHSAIYRLPVRADA